ncbi:MAG: zinc ribbon domain-containing protein [Sedimentisphaerales bacterium]|nr:zinc ribbon domain-containing protein [Sedimentisphaerales bacterium]
MPTYEYACENCGHEFEQFQSITARALRKCPRCGKLKLNRLLGTGAGIIFKGSGFYETDYRSKSYTEAQKKESGANSTTKDDKKTDTKESKASETKASDSGSKKADKGKKKPA